MPAPVLYPRGVGPRLAEALEDSPVVLIHGPRQCGKTTLAQYTCTDYATVTEGGHLLVADRGSLPATTSTERRDYAYISFDDGVARDGARADPAGFVAELPERVILDEIQRVPELFEAIKMEVDRRRAPGRFLLTGSTNVLLLPRLSESLAGRMEIVRLHPLAQRELATGRSPVYAHGPAEFLDALFGAGFDVAADGPARRRSPRARGRRRLSAPRWRVPPPGAGPTGSATTLRPWSSATCATWRASQRPMRCRGCSQQQRRKPPGCSTWRTSPRRSRSAGRRSEATSSCWRGCFCCNGCRPGTATACAATSKRPKLHFGDTGLAAALLGADAAALQADRTLLGQLLETFVYQELRRQASWHAAATNFFHFRDRDGVEVDIVVEQGHRAVAGLEVKAAATVRPGDFRGLRKLASAGGDRFACGVVLYDGEMSARFGDRLYAVPIRRLWEAP